MADEQLQRFLEKVSQLNAFVALTESQPALREALRHCATHQQVVLLARSCGFEIGRRWGEEALAEEALAEESAEAMETAIDNLLISPCPNPGQERSTVLLDTPKLRLERIHSCSATSPEGFWYDQREHEWVTLLQGSARLRFSDEPQVCELNRGDQLLISAHRRHRLEQTDQAPGTIWLALFWPPE